MRLSSTISIFHSAYCSELIKQFQTDGGVDALHLIMSKLHSFPDEDILFMALSAYDNLEKLKIAPEGTVS